MDAKEARRIAESMLNSERIHKEILDRIKVAAENGEMHTRWYSNISERNIEILNKNGYWVDTIMTTPYMNGYVTIKWG